ncbi:MAG: 5-bromo-4-chloroindolyl phosphate hydrolysis family protein [Clostridia bacterium]|nr:5-bromo-4-chloroindolyl phosphate hydrolysis family protein [Clostridia bacterium]
MKKKYILSSILALIIFAISYTYLSLDLLLSLAVGIGSYYGAYLIIPNKKVLIEETKSLDEIIDYGYDRIKEIREVLNKLEEETIKKNFRAVCESTEKILVEIKNKPKKANQIKNFLSYYLPISVKILNQYDEVENQRLTSEDSKKFMEKVLSLSEKVKEATKNQLNSMYNEELINTSADIKVFETMLKSDGLLDSSKIKVEIKDIDGKEE